MKTPRVLVTLTVLNAFLLLFNLAQSSSGAAQGVAPVLRGRALEIVDEAGRVRASLSILPADPKVKMPDGTVGVPETVLLRLITSKGRPNVKLAATEEGAAQLVASNADPGYVQILADGRGIALKLSDKDGKAQILKP